MRNTCRFLCLALAAVTTACSSTAFAPQAVSPAGTPYAGLDENSYGPRTTTQFRLCDPQDGAAGSANAPAAAPSRFSAATQAVSTVAAAPIQGLMKIDARLQSLDLAGQFKDPVGSTFPPVAVLSHAKDSIVFWHSARVVSLQEISQAAQAYCGRSQRPVLYRGSSTRCPAAERGLTGAAVVNTYLISAYACTARP